MIEKSEKAKQLEKYLNGSIPVYPNYRVSIENTDINPMYFNQNITDLIKFECFVQKENKIVLVRQDYVAGVISYKTTSPLELLHILKKRFDKFAEEVLEFGTFDDNVSITIKE